MRRLAVLREGVGFGLGMGDGGWDPSRLVNHADHPRLAVRVLGAVEPRRGSA